ncbi:MAG TPA: hypothetical protein VHK65_00410 [Candidatus Dormibacteraeota bacterium]|nr:hypothetical protein [Candidatus Dormibacteraeota bacterium]
MVSSYTFNGGDQGTTTTIASPVGLLFLPLVLMLLFRGKYPRW